MTADEFYLLLSLGAAIKAGQAIMTVYESDFTVEEKQDHSPLTLADKRANEIITSCLASTSIPVLSEEGRQVAFEERRCWRRLWIVDPLDGTKEFIKKNGEFTVNIALVENGSPVLGVIFIPAREVLYFGAAGLGSYKTNDASLIQDLAVKLPGSTTDILSRADRLPLDQPPRDGLTIVGSRSHMTEAVEAFVEEKRAQHGRVEFVAAGSSLKICLVAEGTADLYPRLGPTMEWDIAAGHAIADYSGARFSCFETGEKMRYNKKDLRNPWFIVEKSNRTD